MLPFLCAQTIVRHCLAVERPRPAKRAYPEQLRSPIVETPTVATARSDFPYWWASSSARVSVDAGGMNALRDTHQLIPSYLIRSIRSELFDRNSCMSLPRRARKAAAISLAQDATEVAKTSTATPSKAAVVSLLDPVNAHL